MAETVGDTMEILIFGDITKWPGDESDVASYGLAKVIAESDAKNIIVKINSYGGEVAEGIAIYNLLREKSEKGVQVITKNMGFACSIAAVIFCAGDQRVMMPGSMLMVHHAWSTACGNAAELRRQADDLEKISAQAEEALKRVASIPENELTAMLDEEEWLTAEEALACGFATKAQEDSEAAGAAAYDRNTVLQRIKSYVPQDPKNPQPGQGNPPAKQVESIFKNFRREK